MKIGTSESYSIFPAETHEPPVSLVEHMGGLKAVELELKAVELVGWGLM